MSARPAFVLVVSVLLNVLSLSGAVRAQTDNAELSRFRTASIGDASILNPILNADSASSSICELVFEGLIDRDENLNWRGRLAERWDLFEEAYLVVDPKGQRTAEQMADLIRSAQEKRGKEDTPLGRCLRNIFSVAVQPAQTVVHKVSEDAAGPDGEKAATITVRQPARVKLTLKKVDQDLFDTLGEIIGKGYISSFKGGEYVEVSPERFAANKEKYAAQFAAAAEHNPVILFHLRKGVKFHDGHEFDSGDVKFTYEAIMDPRNISARVSDYEPVKSVETPDRYTVRITCKELYSLGLGTWAMGVLPEHLLNKEQLGAEAARRGAPIERFGMRWSDFNRRPVGCGPFQFAEWKPNDRIRLKRFEGYWDGAAEFKEYECRVIPDTRKQIEEFRAGNLDTYGAGPGEAEAARKDERYQSFSGLSFGYSYIGYNMRRELFKDKRVRQALGMALDVDAMIKKTVAGQGERITGPFVLQTDYYDKTVKPLPCDPKAALRLLAEAGWKANKDGKLEDKNGNRFAFRLITNDKNDIRRDIMSAAQESWQKLGIDVEIGVLEWSAFLDKHIDQADFDACVLGWAMGIEPDLYQIWHSSQANPYQLNFVGFSNKQADDLIMRIRREYDEEKLGELCHRLHRIIADEQPYTFLYVGKWTGLLDKRIVTVRRDANGRITGYDKVRQTKSGNYMFDFNRWTKQGEPAAR